MASREVVCDTEESCRQKASEKFEFYKSSTKSTNPEMDDFSVLKDVYDRAKYVARRSRENLERGHHRRHIDAPNMAIAFETAARTAVHIMDLACSEMKTLTNEEGQPLTRVNCTSKQFESCVRALRLERKHLPVVSTIIDREILPLIPDPSPETFGNCNAPALQMAS